MPQKSRLISFIKDMNTGRDYDIAVLLEEYAKAGTDSARKNIYDAAMKIRNESARVRAMREALIRAHRNGDVQEVKDIHDYIQNKIEYK